MRHAIILAGGSGTRLWPASRRAKPKQLLSLTDDGVTLISRAVEMGRAVADRVTIVTAEALADATAQAVPGTDIITEPCGRNTAAAIALAAVTIAERDPHSVLAILPADQHVRDRDGMATALDACLRAAETRDEIALVGIPPTRAETGFGYLEIASGPVGPTHEVLRFVEKPDRATAETYVASGRYLWNAGIFCLTARRLIAELDTHLPQVAYVVRHNQESYETLPSVSFDHGVMEHVRGGVVAVPANVGWNDVGSWAALPEVAGRGADGNTIVGNGSVIDGSGNVVLSDDGTVVAVVGVSDLVVVKSGDAILVVKREEAQRVREVVDELKKRKLGGFL